MDIPEELLCEVFVSLPFADRVQATHVCKLWRNVSLSRPGTLWSCIEYDGERVGVVPQLLDRAKAVPVDVKVLLTDGTFAETMAAISLHLSHIRRLVLYNGGTGEYDLSARNLHHVYAALAYPAPVLEALEIEIDGYVSDSDESDDDHEELDFDYRIPTNLFAAHAPLLRMAAWKAMQLSSGGTPSLAGLTKFAFKVEYFLTKSQLINIVNHLPCLKALHIDARDGYELPTTPRPPSFLLDELDIQMMLLYMRSQMSLLPLLEFFGYLQIPRVTTMGYQEWPEHFIASPRGMPHTLHIEESRSVLDNWRMQADSGYLSRCDGLNSTKVMVLPATRHIFERLDALVIPMRVVIDSESLPPLHNLTRLSILCRDGYDVHALVGAACRPMCSNLRLLEFIGPSPPMKRLVLTSENLERVMEAIFGAGGQRWPHITLTNITLDTQPEATATKEGRTQLFSDVSLADHPRPLSLTRERQLNWHVTLPGSA